MQTYGIGVPDNDVSYFKHLKEANVRLNCISIFVLKIKLFVESYNNLLKLN